jgi:hypothetical protein
MKTIVGLFWSVFAGAFFGFGIIALFEVIGVGAEKLGFTQYTLSYYILSLCLCVALLIGSRAARQRMKFMLFFAIALMLVFGIGFLTFIEPSPSSDQFAQLQVSTMGLSMLLAQGVMYSVPGALVAFYAYLAYNDLVAARAESHSGA